MTNTSILLAWLFAFIVLIAFIYYFLVKKKDTRERFAFFALSSYTGFIITLLWILKTPNSLTVYLAKEIITGINQNLNQNLSLKTMKYFTRPILTTHTIDQLKNYIVAIELAYWSKKE